MSKSYWEKLKDPRWQKKRLEILQRDQFRCRHCDDNSSTLHVHHGYYRSGTDPWDYEDFNFTTLCEVCHSRVEDLKMACGMMIADRAFFEAFGNLHNLICYGHHETVIQLLANLKAELIKPQIIGALCQKCPG